MGYLIGETVVPPPTDPTYKMWEAKNSIFMAWLINSMDPKNGRAYLFYNTAREIWIIVEEMYFNLHNLAQIGQLPNISTL